MKQILITLFCMLLASAAYARKIDHWPYERLFKESDLVVIADVQAVINTAEEWNEKYFDKNRFEGMKTAFGAKFVLKGSPPLCIWLNHFRYKEGSPLYNDGPAFVILLNESQQTEVGKNVKNKPKAPTRNKKLVIKSSQPEYLLFLKKLKDGTYEPVSGQMDAALSVRTLLPSMIKTAP